MSRRTWSADEIAAGHGHPGVAELAALIHRVNPTDRGLSQAEQAHRYVLKAKLQSRLLRDWSEHLVLRIEGDGDILSIEHKGHKRDAAHVRLDALDPDARSLVYRALDLPKPPSESPSQRARMGESGPTDSLSQGAAALDAWDFDAARACFERAFAETRSEPAAFALLDLLVDRLGLDDDGLALELGEALLSGRNARLVALAAARTGDRRRAQRLLDRLDVAGEAEVRVILAEDAVQSRDLSEIRCQLDALRTLSPADAALIRIEDALRALEATDRAPAEARLSLALDTGEPDAIRAAAEALLAASPGHGAARAALARLEAGERARAVEAHTDAARVLAEAGQWSLAVVELQKAAALGADVRDALEVARAGLVRERDEAAIALARRALQSGALAPYLALSSEQRAELREREGAPRLVRLERLLGEGARDPASVLVALEQAESLLADGRPEAAMAALQRVSAESLQSGRPLVRAVREALVEQRQQRTAVLLARLRERLADRDDEGAEPILDELDVEYILEAERPEAMAQIAQLSARLSDARALASFDALVIDAHPFDARLFAEKRLAEHQKTPLWRARIDALEQRLMRMIPSKPIESWREDLADVHPPSIQISADSCIEPDGRHAWLTEARERFCFLRRIEIATGRVCSCTVVRTIDPFTRPRTARIGEVLCLAAAGGRILLLRVGEDGRCTKVINYLAPVNQEIPKPEYVDPGRDPELRPLIRDYSRGTDKPLFFLWDIPRKGAFVMFDGPLSCHPLRLHGIGDRVLCHHPTGEVRLLDPSDHKSSRVGYALRVDSVIAAPDGVGIVCVGAFPPGDGQEHALALLNPETYHPTARFGLPSMRRGVHPLATSRPLGRIYLLADRRVGAPELSSFDSSLRRVWSVSHPGLVHLLTDPEDNHVALVVLTERGPQIVPLGLEAPELPSDIVGAYQAPSPLLALAPDALRASLLPSEERPDAERTELLRLLAAVSGVASVRERFQRLDVPPVWRSSELQSLARLAEAALDWDEPPWERRLHAIATFVEMKLRQEQGQQVFALEGLPDTYDPERLTALCERAKGWLDSRSDESLSLLRAGKDNPHWPPP